MKINLDKGNIPLGIAIGATIFLLIAALTKVSISPIVTRTTFGVGIVAILAGLEYECRKVEKKAREKGIIGKEYHPYITIAAGLGLWISIYTMVIGLARANIVIVGMGALFGVVVGITYGRWAKVQRVINKKLE